VTDEQQRDFFEQIKEKKLDGLDGLTRIIILKHLL